MLQLVDGIEGAALAGAIDALLVTQQNADRAGIAGPVQGWGPWATSLSAAGQGQLDPAPANDSIGTSKNVHSDLTLSVMCVGVHEQLPLSAIARQLVGRVNESIGAQPIHSGTAVHKTDSCCCSVCRPVWSNATG